MIARIRGYQNRRKYVALHLDPRTDDLWVPIRGDRGKTGEASALEAAMLCVKDLARRIRPAIEQAKRLAQICDRRGRPRTDNEERRMRDLSSRLAATLERVGLNLSRLLDEPTAADRVDIDAEYERSEPM